MCLRSLDPKIRRHKKGYKIYSYDMRTKTLRSRFAYGSVNEFEVGKTYSAAICSGGKEVPVIGALDGTSYKAGFHYFLRLRDARKSITTTPTSNESEVIVRVKIENILATGVESSRYDCGVSEIITLEKIVSRIPVYPRDHRDMKHSRLLRLSISKRIISLLSKFKTREEISEDIKSEFRRIVKTDREMIKFIILIDTASRETAVFKRAIYLWMSVLTEDKFRSLYKTVTTYKEGTYGYDALRDMTGYSKDFDHLLQ